MKTTQNWLPEGPVLSSSFLSRPSIAIVINMLAVCGEDLGKLVCGLNKLNSFTKKRLREDRLLP
jgi:hypothetical protein